MCECVQNHNATYFPCITIALDAKIDKRNSHWIVNAVIGVATHTKSILQMKSDEMSTRRREWKWTQRKFELWNRLSEKRKGKTTSYWWKWRHIFCSRSLFRCHFVNVVRRYDWRTKQIELAYERLLVLFVATIITHNAITAKRATAFRVCDRTKANHEPTESNNEMRRTSERKNEKKKTGILSRHGEWVCNTFFHCIFGCLCVSQNNLGQVLALNSFKIFFHFFFFFCFLLSLSHCWLMSL